jgi:hypothetical protein
MALRRLRARRRSRCRYCDADHAAKLNEVEPQAWLADVLARIADHPAQRLEELLPSRWAALARVDQAA